MRHHIGRMRRLCQAFSKRGENHRAAVALGYVHYNFCHVVSTLRVTPAMAVGLTDHVWSLAELEAALRTAGPADVPEKQPLVPRIPETTARELPNGRGFLRVVDGGKGKPETPKPLPPSPVMVAHTKPIADENGQLSLFPSGVS